eukprot:g46225.t1
MVKGNKCRDEGCRKRARVRGFCGSHAMKQQLEVIQVFEKTVQEVDVTNPKYSDHRQIVDIKAIDGVLATLVVLAKNAFVKSFGKLIIDDTKLVMAQQARQPEPAEEPVGEQAQVRPAQDPERSRNCKFWVDNKEGRSEVSMYRYHSPLKSDQIPDYRLAVYPDNSVKLFRLMDNVVKISAYYDLDPLTIYKAYFQTEEA